MIEELKQGIDKLLNQPVTFKRTMGRALVLYFLDEPGEEKTQLFHLEPPWRYQKNNKLISASQDIPWSSEDFESKEAYKEEFHRVCNLNNSLLHSKLKSYQIDENTHDLELLFEDNQKLEMFADGIKDYQWSFADTQVYYYVYADRIEKEEKSKNAP